MAGYIDPFDRPLPAPNRSVVISSMGYMNPWYGRQPLGGPVREGDEEWDYDTAEGEGDDEAMAGAYDDGDADDGDEPVADDRDQDEGRAGSCAADGCGTEAFHSGFCWPHLMQHLMRLRNARFGRPQRRKKERPQQESPQETAPQGPAERLGENRGGPSFKGLP